MTIEDIAKVCHEANRAYCQAIGDNTQVPWGEAAHWQRESAVKGVEFAIKTESPPSAQHESWLAQKMVDGWIYGPVKDAFKKEHPCIVPYDKLPAEQKCKDALFVAVVAALKGAL